MMSEQRKKVMERRGAFGAGDLDYVGKDEAIQIIVDAFAGLPADAELNHTGDGYFNVEWARDETDEEFRVRTMTEESKASIRRAEERRTLRELAQKYPDVIANLQKQG